MQQISFQVEIGFLVDITADIEAKLAYDTGNTTLIYLYLIGQIVAAAQITNGHLRLRLNVPAVLAQAVFTAIFSTQRDAGIIKITGYPFAIAVKNSEVAVHMVELRHNV